MIAPNKLDDLMAKMAVVLWDVIQRRLTELYRRFIGSCSNTP